jgi:hypothetical protein
MTRRRLSARLRPIAILAMTGWLATSARCGLASGQSLANQVINNFEITPAGSLEWEILNRLAATQQYNPRDLPRLARMTLLETIAMYENLRADLPMTMAGARIEGEMSQLWDAAELFSVGVTPADASSLLRSRPMLADVEAAYARLDATLGSMPGVSPRAALHLRDIARLLPVMNTLIDAMEADQGVPAEVPAVPNLDVVFLREQARLLVEDLRGASRPLAAMKPAPAGLGALIADLDSAVELVQGFDRLLAAGASSQELVESLRRLRSRLWPIEARFLQVMRTPALAGRWRPIRQRFNAMSDRFNRPRVIALEPASAVRPAVGVDRRLLAEADRAIVTLDAFLGQESSNAAPTATGGAQYQDELGQLRRNLLLFRQQVAAGESAESLARSLRTIEDLNRRLSERARAEGRIFRGNTRIDTRGLQEAAQAVEKLRDLVPKAAGPGQPPRS